MTKLSLRLRLIILFVIISGIFGAMAGVLSWQETKEKIDEFFDTYQIALARQLAAADWSTVSPRIQQATDRLLDNIADADDEDEAIGFAVFDKNGRKVFHDDQNGRDFAYTPVIGSYVEQRVDDEKWRIVWIYSADQQYVIAVGQELDYREDIAWDMAEEFVSPWIFGLAALLLMMIVVITIEFLPLNKLAREVQHRPEGDLSPLPTAGLPEEVQPLLLAMNQLLGQTENMLRRERSFIADSAHELRTPLTALKVQLEVLELSLDDKPARTEALKKLEGGIERASRLVEQLLALSKIDTASAAKLNEREIISWRQIWMQLKDGYRSEAEAKGIEIIEEFSGNGPIGEGNPVLCALLLRNLLDNAIKYSPNKAVIRAEIAEGSLKVINSDSCVDEKSLAKLGQRFYRPAGQKVPGSGLGLSIVKKIAEFYGCSVSFGNTENGFKAEVKA